MESEEERRRRLEREAVSRAWKDRFPFPETIESLLDRLEKKVEDIEAGRDPEPVPVVPAEEPERDMNDWQKKYSDFDAEGVRKNALKVGGLVAAVAWLAIGGWTGAGCYGCAEGGSAALGAIGFVLVGVLSAFLIGVAAATATAFVPCVKRAEDFDDALYLYEEVCWGEEEVAVASVVISILGCLLAVGVIVGAVFSLL
jgi:hypothetical protein